MASFFLATTTVQAFQCNQILDIILVVDGSTSVETEWSTVKTFLKDLVGRFEVSREKAHIGVVTFAENAQYSIALSDGQDGPIVQMLLGMLTCFLFSFYPVILCILKFTS